jgi:Mg-chelatase subunit ChlD
MTSPPAAAAAGGQHQRPRPKSGRPEGKTTGRHELARHARFSELSPEVGVLDETAMSQALATDPAAFELLAAMTTATDERLRAAARRLSASIVLDRARAGRAARRGSSRLERVRGALDGDLDLDATVDAVAAARAEGRPAGIEDLTTVHWARPLTAFAVVVDRSGSMTGARLAAAATVAAACALRAPREHAVLAFAASPELIRPLVSDMAAATVADRLLRLRGHGVTRLADALKAAREQLAPARARRQVVILLSDCRSTDDDDTVETARGLAELIILAPGDDCEQAAQLAGQAGARWGAVDHPLDAALLLDRLLAAPAAAR